MSMKKQFMLSFLYFIEVNSFFLPVVFNNYVSYSLPKKTKKTMYVDRNLRLPMEIQTLSVK